MASHAASAGERSTVDQRRYRRVMRYLDVDGVGRVSRIGLGTWQFGSREWGYGDDYAVGRGPRHRAARARAGGDAVRHRRDLRLRQERAHPRRGARRRAHRGGGGQQDLPGRAVSRGGQAARARQRPTAAAGPHPALPDPPVQPGGARFGDHAGHARACSTAATSARPASRTTRWRGGRRPMRRSGGR